MCASTPAASRGAAIGRPSLASAPAPSAGLSRPYVATRGRRGRRRDAAAVRGEVARSRMRRSPDSIARQAAVIEAGHPRQRRLHLLPRDKIEPEVAALEIVVGNTAGPNEQTAWNWLRSKFDADFAAITRRHPADRTVVWRQTRRSAEGDRRSRQIGAQCHARRPTAFPKFFRRTGSEALTPNLATSGRPVSARVGQHQIGHRPRPQRTPDVEWPALQMSRQRRRPASRSFNVDVLTDLDGAALGSDSGSSPAATIEGLNILVCKPVKNRGASGERRRRCSPQACLCSVRSAMLSCVAMNRVPM